MRIPEHAEINKYEDDSDFDIFEPVNCMECPIQFNHRSDLGNHLQEAHKLC